MIFREVWNKPEARFLVLFLGILSLSFFLVALRQVDATIVAPYTSFVARVSGMLLRFIGEPTTVSGCVVSSVGFAGAGVVLGAVMRMSCACASGSAAKAQAKATTVCTALRIAPARMPKSPPSVLRR